MKNQNIKIDLLHPIFAQKKTIVAITFIIFSFSIYIAFFWPPTYSATASILIREKGVQKIQWPWRPSSSRSTSLNCQKRT